MKSFRIVSVVLATAGSVLTAGVLGTAASARQPAPAPAAEPAPPSPLEIYQQTLDLGSWVSVGTLTVEDVAYSFEKAINGRDGRESAVISEWRGVHQSGDSAAVLFSVTGMDVVFSDDFTISERGDCVHLNDGRWWCEATIERLSIPAAFYLERAPLGDVEEAVAGRPSAPPR